MALRLDCVDARTVPIGRALWLKDHDTDVIAAFLDVLTSRGLDLRYVGPGDRYQVVSKVLT